LANFRVPVWASDARWQRTVSGAITLCPLNRKKELYGAGTMKKENPFSSSKVSLDGQSVRPSNENFGGGCLSLERRGNLPLFVHSGSNPKNKKSKGFLGGVFSQG